MIYKQTLQTILNKGVFIKRTYPLISLYNYNLNLTTKKLEEILNLLSDAKKLKFKTEFDMFLEGEIEVKKYNDNTIKYWNYLGEYFINSYPQFYPKFNAIIKKFHDDSKNHILFLGNNEYSNQQPCMSAIQFQRHNNKLYLSVLQRSSDANLGFLADIYHLFLFANKLNTPIEQINILYGNIHIYENNIKETKRYIKENGSKPPYHFIQNNIKK